MKPAPNLFMERGRELIAMLNTDFDHAASRRKPRPEPQTLTDAAETLLEMFIGGDARIPERANYDDLWRPAPQ